ncbi:MAG: hypothetical protein F6J90_34335 [Moorea sp. SIOASIH]|uniref:hypothetical protein n=1 Tax=Moorena sp. SIOASIH TaxID=2607817 RepID=UPI0013B91472|nr:hypothetical protein [Moorena sp. SIOASIH]NEO41130.1 hypothetical protein [Moorena sp. SIOASIH]
MGETTPVAHGGDHGSRSWGKPRQLLMGGTPKTALAPQDRAASPRPRCLPCSEAASLLQKTTFHHILWTFYMHGFSETLMIRGVSAYFLLTYFSVAMFLKL